jgi:hypothetical protein
LGVHILPPKRKMYVYGSFRAFFFLLIISIRILRAPQLIP